MEESLVIKIKEKKFQTQKE